MFNTILQREKELLKMNEEIDSKTNSIFNRNSDAGVNKKSIVTRKIPTIKNQIFKSTNNQFNAKSTVPSRPDDTVSNDGNSCNQPSGHQNHPNTENECLLSANSSSSSSSSTSSSHSSASSSPHQQKMQKCSNANSDSYQNSPDNLIPKIFEKRKFSSEGLIKFLKSKASILQVELETTQKENCEHVKKINELAEYNKQMELVKDQLSNRGRTLEKSVTKLQEQNMVLEKKQKEQDNTITVLSKELDNTKSELKSTKHIFQCYEKRFFKLQDELEATKAKLCAANDSEKIIRNTARLDRAANEKQIKALRRDNNNLTKDIKQQSLLIDDLREEIARLEKQKIFEIADPDDIVKILNWKLDDA